LYGSLQIDPLSTTHHEITFPIFLSSSFSHHIQYTCIIATYGYTTTAPLSSHPGFAIFSATLAMEGVLNQYVPRLLGSRRKTIDEKLEVVDGWQVPSAKSFGQPINKTRIENTNQDENEIEQQLIKLEDRRERSRKDRSAFLRLRNNLLLEYETLAFLPSHAKVKTDILMRQPWRFASHICAISVHSSAESSHARFATWSIVSSYPSVHIITITPTMVLPWTSKNRAQYH
jgi:hypothetical protein